MRWTVVFVAGIAAIALLGILSGCGPDGDSDNSATHFSTKNAGTTYHCIWLKVSYAGGLWCERSN